MTRTAVFKSANTLVGWLLQQAAERIDVTHQPKPGEVFKGQETIRVQGIFGRFELRRDYYYDAGRKQGHYPADVALGLEVSYTPALAKLMCLEGADETTYLNVRKRWLRCVAPVQSAGMGLIDTHTHLESFMRHGTLEAALARARQAGVEAMITIGTSPDDWTLYRDLVAQQGGWIRYTVGLHPCAVVEGWEEAVAGIERFWAADGAPPESSVPIPMPVALGECGLDRFHLPKDPAEAEKNFSCQRSAFAAQLVIGRKLGCPIVVHSRGAFRDCVEMVDASGVDWSRVVFHCFTEGPAEIAELSRRGGIGSFTGILTYKNAAAAREAARAQGLERFMVETDAPYLTPMPHRGKPNEPAYVRHTAEFAAAEVFGVSFGELAAITTANARRFFGLGVCRSRTRMP